MLATYVFVKFIHIRFLPKNKVLPDVLKFFKAGQHYLTGLGARENDYKKNRKCEAHIDEKQWKSLPVLKGACGFLRRAKEQQPLTHLFAESWP